MTTFGKLEKMAADINRLRDRLARKGQSPDLLDRHWRKFHSLRLELAEALSGPRRRTERIERH